MGNCYSCGQTLNAETDYGRRETCSTCGRDTKVCLNCVHYDSKRYNECSEPVAERVIDKDKSNFCDYFSPTSDGQKQSSENIKSGLKSAADALFKKK